MSKPHLRDVKKKVKEGWEDRQTVREWRQEQHNAQTKEWKEREKKIKKGELPEPRRRSCYLP